MSSTTTLTMDIRGMHCGSCAMLVDETLEDLPGVIKSSTNLRKGCSTVVIDASRTSPAKLVKAVSRLGYRATLTR